MSTFSVIMWTFHIAVEKTPGSKHPSLFSLFPVTKSKCHDGWWTWPHWRIWSVLLSTDKSLQEGPDLNDWIYWWFYSPWMYVVWLTLGGLVPKNLQEEYKLASWLPWTSLGGTLIIIKEISLYIPGPGADTTELPMWAILLHHLSMPARQKSCRGDSLKVSRGSDGWGRLFLVHSPGPLQCSVTWFRSCLVVLPGTSHDPWCWLWTHHVVYVIYVLSLVKLQPQFLSTQASSCIIFQIAVCCIPSGVESTLWNSPSLKPWEI